MRKGMELWIERWTVKKLGFQRDWALGMFRTWWKPQGLLLCLIPRRTFIKQSREVQGLWRPWFLLWFKTISDWLEPEGDGGFLSPQINSCTHLPPTPSCSLLISSTSLIASSEPFSVQGLAHCRYWINLCCMNGKIYGGFPVVLTFSPRSSSWFRTFSMKISPSKPNHFWEHVVSTS